MKIAAEAGQPSVHGSETYSGDQYHAWLTHREGFLFVFRTSERAIPLIEDLRSLCKRADPRMPEEEEIRPIRKGIREDVFQLSITKDPKMVADLIEICKSLQDTRSSRIRIRWLPSLWGRYPSYLRL